MSGTSGEDLWISTYRRAPQGEAAGVLTTARAAAASWRDVFRSRGGQLESLGSRFVAALADGAGDAALARIAAAETLAARLGTPWAELEDLAGRGATLQETVLAALLGVWSSRPAPEVFADVRPAGPAGAGCSPRSAGSRNRWRPRSRRRCARPAADLPGAAC